MRIKIVYDDEQQNSIANSFILNEFKVRLNNMPVTDLSFDRPKELYLENAQVLEKKKNIISFRRVEPGEKEEKTRNILVNILLGFLFIVMAIILPFAFMRFKSVNKPFNKLKFEYSSTHDFVLVLRASGFAYGYEASSEAAQTDPFAGPFVPAAEGGFAEEAIPAQKN